ncbi:GntR family transcriptional regulator [archaeon]|jgi:predicted nucleotidyltransferase|nr:GntR family transcriptional regulator [archaeon]MBT4373690.1 GntR family transcriptional regulator [archaeon]MBT4531744.1 GntR family transcriptional regulator [archaeon]MBT7001856.1 GntR family transcriptional regulator [archaeon]MBT7281841.1 GntR family transcriptional regulator [archaeon]
MVNKYELKFTSLQTRIFRLFCIKTGETLNQREIARNLGVSATAISKSLDLLEKEKLIIVNKNKTMNLNLIGLNQDSKKVVELKRVENMGFIYKSGLVDFLEVNFPGSVIILFGSYSYGEDNVDSDIDIAVFGSSKKNLNLSRFDDFLEREIRVNFYKDFNEVNKNLMSNIFNGIILSGRISL